MSEKQSDFDSIVIPVTCHFCKKEALATMEYIWGPGAKHFEVECNECKAKYSYDDYSECI